MQFLSNSKILKSQQNKIEYGNRKNVKDTMTRLKSRKHPKATKETSTWRESPTSGAGPQLALNYNVY